MSELQEALRAVAAEVGTVAKDARNEHHGYSYASAEAVLRKVREACARHGVAITKTTAEVLSADGPTRIVRLTQVYAKGQEGASFQGLGEGKDSQDKGVMKANTAALKYLLAAAFNISWGDDPEASDPETGKSTRSAAKKTAKAAPTKSEPATDGAAFAALAAEVKAMTPANQEAVRARIKARKDDLTDAEYNRLVDAYRAKAQ